jgi:hypothetical protein
MNMTTAANLALTMAIAAALTAALTAALIATVTSGQMESSNLAGLISHWGLKIKFETANVPAIPLS